jgi:molecular chaperone GrpE
MEKKDHRHEDEINHEQEPGEKTVNSVAPGDSETKASEQELQYKELNDKYTRLYADFDNFRRRTSKERLDWLKSAGEDTILSLLPVLDDMERAIAHNKNVNDAAALKEGMEIICQKFRNLISSRGVEPMETAGKLFDPELHDAVTSIDAPSGDLKGKVIEEVQKGYMLNGKVIRHAKVVVGK